MAHTGIQISLAQLMGLIVVFALTISLLFTPGAPLIVAILIVVPGFLIDRLRGGTGIIGGTISSPILAVILAIIGFYISSEGSFSEFLAAGPAVYFIAVASLMWGGVASMILYWVIKTYHERRSRSPAAKHSPIQFTLGQLMGLIVVCAFVFAALSTPFAIFVAALGIVVPGFLYDRFRGGAGIVGGMISAVIVLEALGMAAYTYGYFYADPALLAYLGPPIPMLLLLGVAGAAWGALVGTVIDVVILVKNSYKKANPPPPPPVDEETSLITWLPEETKER